ncbi:hypothetical protein A0128_14045 [Leptospira tipperaryensis]|uniref:Outer membrane protein beta-barrel domain-containing protein n=1 Tax=Leptospira tipperaryensis TaxID=2564040 RepID=A0A1D7UZ62_9LEPT|nr:hypothetical protein [Leptospira tipperaryensis]AOP34869.1 hypothetical protein A0128_14045 [Leptospira tipperaryensis]
MKTLKLVLLIVFGLLAFEIVAQEKSQTSDRPSGSYENSNWSIQYGFGAGSAKYTVPSQDSSSALLPLLLTSSSTSSNNLLLPLLLSSGSSKDSYSGSTYHGRFFAEYLPGHVGLLFGMSSTVFDLKLKQSAMDQLAPLLTIQALFSPTSSSSSTAASTSILYLLPLLTGGTDTKIQDTITYFDVGPTFHARPRKTFDPYFALGIGAGSCSGNCYSYRGFAKLGLRVNFGGGYLFLEAEQSQSEVRIGKISSDPIQNQIGIFGFGLYL